MTIFNYDKIVELLETDILIVGAGSAGCTAAIAASGKKYSVTIIERYGFAGGTSTQMLDTFYGFFTPGTVPRKIVGGIPDIIVNELDKTHDIFLRPNTYGAGTGVSYNPERLKMVWDELLIKKGIWYFLHTTLVDVVPMGDEKISCIVYHKSGFYKINARRVIDASGDADFCYLAGYGFELAGEKEPAQSMTTTFRMSNVNLEKFEQMGGNKMLKEKMKMAYDSKVYPLPRKEGSAHEMCMPGCIATVAVKVTDLNPLHIYDITSAEIEGRKQSFVYESFFREEVPGYEDARIIGLSTQIGVRETRRVYGEHRLTKEACLSGNIPSDTIFLCGAPIEDHRKGCNGEDETYWEYIPGAGVYGVPYGTLVPEKSKLVWMVGRCFSATHDAHASCRSMAQTMSMGQAAGRAVIQSLEEDVAAMDVDVNNLRTALTDLGQVLEIPAATADTSRNGWKNNIH